MNRPIGGTHVRTQCTYCGGTRQEPSDALTHVRFSCDDPYELICDSCFESNWGDCVGDYEKGMQVLARTRCIQISKGRKVSGALIGRDSVAWYFTNNGVESSLTLSCDAMQAIIMIYAALLRDRIASEWKQKQ